MQPAIPISLETRYLGAMTIEVDQPIDLGATPAGRRRFDLLKGGTFKGPRIDARIFPGTDSLVLRADGSYQPDVRLAMETHDGHRILVTYRGVRVASDEVSARLLAGEHLPYTAYYLRNAPFFEVAPGPYDWLNGIVSVGVGRREGMQVIYEVFEVL